MLYNKISLREAAILERYQPLSMEVNDTVMIRLLGERNEKVFEQVFKSNFKSLHAYAFTIVKDEMMAEEMVQNVFYKIWERTEQLSINSSIKAYLYRAVYNESLNYLKHQKVRATYQTQTSWIMKDQTDNASKKILHRELSEKLQQAMNTLPEQCRTIFQMSRFEELRYREIADRLSISVKTVENQMGKALKLLRIKLADFLPLVALSILEHLNNIF